MTTIRTPFGPVQLPRIPQLEEALGSGGAPAPHELAEAAGLPPAVVDPLRQLDGRRVANALGGELQQRLQAETAAIQAQVQHLTSAPERIGAAAAQANQEAHQLAGQVQRGEVPLHVAGDRLRGIAERGFAAATAPPSTAGAGGHVAPAPAHTASAVSAPAPQGRPGDVSPAQLQDIARRSGYSLSDARAQQVAPHLNYAMAEANINTPRQKAAFVAQLMHESAAFRYNEEIASGAAYEGRRDLGNTQPGDGQRYKGRGFIQLTGRANYAAASQALGTDFVNNPHLAAQDGHAARVAAWYWNTRGLNSLAEQGRYDDVTLRINGGYNGKADRDRLYANALTALA